MFLRRFMLGVLLVGGAGAVVAAEPKSAPAPNIVYILADDLGWGDLGCYGQTKIKTPHLDQLARQGMRFTQAYAGSTVCAPSRCTLMTGLHTGHCRTRGNGGGGTPRSNVPLAPEDPCVAELLQKAGYSTALVGKWGLGEEGSTGVPTKKGFGHFYGYLNQHHAHNYYPDFLWRGESKETINNPQSMVDGVAREFNHYAPDLLLADALKFIGEHQSNRFLLFFSTTLPHANNEKTRVTGNGNEVPSQGAYANENWPEPEKSKAAMITRLDDDVGRILAKLKELKLEENTLVLFSSDNGPHQEGGNKSDFFASSGPFRGIKRSLADGGIRMPTIARWPGTIKAGVDSDHICAFWDFLPTMCELAGVESPSGLDGLSFAPTLLGRDGQKSHEFLYWEFHEGGTRQAVRHGDWKAIRPAVGAKLQLFNVVADSKEMMNVAVDHPQVVARIENYLRTARTESKQFPIVAPKKK